MDRERLDHSLDARPEISLEQRKAEFLQATRELDLLAPLRKHPFLTVGTGLMLGLTAGAPHIAAKVKSARNGLAGRLIKAAGLRAAQYFVAVRAAKAHAAAMASAPPQPAEASA